MSCPSNPLDCAADVGGGVTGSVAASAWEAICKSFADAASALLKAFAEAFVAIPPVDLTSAGIANIYSISLGIAGFVAALLLIGQVIRTAATHDGSALAYGLVGVGKAVLACVLTLTIAATSLRAADELSNWIVVRSFGSTDALSTKIAELVAWQPNGVPSTLIMIIAVVGILLTMVLWFEMLLRNAAVAILIGTAPIPAAGLTAQSTSAWWSKLVAATGQLIVLKPIIALVFSLGLSVTAGASDIETMLTGMLVLLLAVVAWPVVARFFTFASVQVGGGAGLASLLGFAAGRVASEGGAGGMGGVEPDEFSRVAEARTMQAVQARGLGSAAGAEGFTPAGASTGVAAGGGGAAAAGAGPLAAVAAGLGMAQRAVNSVTGRMEQIAGHAGISGANPYAQPAGHVRHPGTVPFRASGGSGRSGGDVAGGQYSATVASPPGHWPTSPAAPEAGFLLPDQLPEPVPQASSDTTTGDAGEPETPTASGIAGTPGGVPTESGLPDAGFAVSDEQPAEADQTLVQASGSDSVPTRPGPAEAGFLIPQQRSAPLTAGQVPTPEGTPEVPAAPASPIPAPAPGTPAVPAPRVPTDPPAPVPPTATPRGTPPPVPPQSARSPTAVSPETQPPASPPPPLGRRQKPDGGEAP